MSSLLTTNPDLAAIAKAILEHDDYVVTTHENPDGDALGSLLACTLALRQIGKKAEPFLYGDSPIPKELAFMDLDGVRRGEPGELLGRPLICLDAANEKRVGQEPRLISDAPFVADIDHHHDNSRYGTLNLIVADASSTAEVLRDLLAELGVELTPEIAEALYVGLVTDTGRFSYANATSKSLRLAAELVDAGANSHELYQRLYESLEYSRAKLLGRAIDNAELFDDGRLVVSYLEQRDFEELSADGGTSEGVVEFLRSIEGTDMAALIQDAPSRPGRRISLRTSKDEIDVSAIARKGGGGGHRRAAGFSSELDIAGVKQFIVAEFRALAQQSAA